MMNAREHVLSMINAAWTTQAIGVACDLALPDHLAAGAQPAAALAQVAGAHPEALQRLLRALVALELCAEDADGAFALAPAGELLRRDRPDSLDAWARMSAGRLWGNWAELGTSVRTGRSTRSRHLGVDDFTHLNANATGAALFNAAMIAFTHPVAQAAAQSLDWSRVGTVVDVGGGVGELATRILAAHRRMRGVVYDLEHAAAAARHHITGAGLADRCEFVAGSFFESVPAADACLLKSVLHNWDDERAALILRRCAAALNPGGRVLLFERVMPQRVAAGDREATRSDLNMLVGCEGRERTEARFGELLAEAGLVLTGTRPLVEGFYVLEATRA